MKTLTQYLTEAQQRIKLPHTFDIYNSGSKNVGHKITKHNIYKIFFSIDDSAIDFIDTYSEFINLPLSAADITYKEQPTKSNTDNWTKVPEVNEHTYAGAYYSDKSVEYNYNQYNEDWDRWLNSLRPYMSGKVSVTLEEAPGRDKTGHKQLIIKVNNDKFNKDREDKINELKNPENLKKYAEEAKRRENEIKQQEKNRIARQSKFDAWWNSLSDDEKKSWSRGYGQNKYMGD
jgi:hypothetical protein